MKPKPKNLILDLLLAYEPEPLDAQDAVAADLSIAEVMPAGGWRSPQMVARYTEHLQARRGAMAKLAAKQNRL